MSKRINYPVLNKWLGKKDENVTKLLQATGITPLTLYLMRTGRYKSTPKEWTRKKFSEITGIKEEELFVDATKVIL